MWNWKQRINRKQAVLTSEQYKKLVQNHQNRDQDHAPVVKFFDPIGAGTWLVSELDPENGIGFGLCDLGFGFPELGSVSLEDMISIQHVSRRPFTMGIERDLHFKGEHPMSWYVNLADAKGGLVGV